MKALVLLSGAFGIGLLSAASASAQNADINDAGAAYEACEQNPRFFGYPDFETCVEEVYKDLQRNQPPGTSIGGGFWGQPGVRCDGTRIPAAGRC